MLGFGFKDVDEIATSFSDGLDHGFKVLGLGLAVDLEEDIAPADRGLAEDGIQAGREKVIPDLFPVEISPVGAVDGDIGERCAGPGGPGDRDLSPRASRRKTGLVCL